MTNPFRRQKWRNSVAIFPPLTWKDRVRGFFVRALRRMNPWRKPIPPGIWKGTTMSPKQVADAFNRLYADSPPKSVAISGICRDEVRDSDWRANVPPMDPLTWQGFMESDEEHRLRCQQRAEQERATFQQAVSPRFAGMPIIVDPNLPPGTGYLITADGKQRHFQVKDPTNER